MPASATNFGAYLSCVSIGAGTLTAAGTGDATEGTGQTIDRDGYDSGVVCISWAATLANTKTISFAVTVQESADGTTWDTAVAIQAATVAKTATSSTTFY